VLDISIRHCLFEVRKREAAREHEFDPEFSWVHAHESDSFYSECGVFAG